jgi:hypothetical protein
MGHGARGLPGCRANAAGIVYDRRADGVRHRRLTIPTHACAMFDDDLRNDENKAAVLAAAAANRRIRTINLVIGLLFAAALIYLLIRVGAASLPGSTFVPPQDDVSVSTIAAADLPTIATPQPISLNRIADLPDDWRFNPPEYTIDGGPARTDATDRIAVEADDRRWRTLIQEGDLKFKEYDYIVAADRYDEARRIEGLTEAERRVAGAAWSRAITFANVTGGIKPLRETARFVRYTNSRQDAVEGWVGRDAQWTLGVVQLTELATGRERELAVTSDWSHELIPVETATTVLFDRFARELAQANRQADVDAAHPLQFRDLAVQMLHIGDFTDQDGRRVNARAIAHGLLGQADSMCAVRNLSLWQTLRLRRDATFVRWQEIEAALDQIESQLELSPSPGELAALRSQVDDLVAERRDVVNSLVTRYPRAWEMRDPETLRDPERLRDQIDADMQAAEEASDPAGLGPMLDAPESAPDAERIGFYMEQGRFHRNRALDMWSKARDRAVPREELRDTFLTAKAHMRRARMYFDRVLAIDETHDEAASLSHLSNADVYGISKDTPVH